MMETYKEILKTIDDIIFIAERARIKVTDEEETQKINKSLASLYVDGAYNIKNNKIGYPFLWNQTENNIQKDIKLGIRLRGYSLFAFIVGGWAYREKKV